MNRIQFRAVAALVLGLGALAAAAQAGDDGPLLFPNSDFEQGDLTNWRLEGDAFQFQPTCGDNVQARRRERTAMQQGRFWAGTYEKYQGKPGEKPGTVQKDKPQGGLISTAFDIREPYLGFLFGGGDVEGLTVQLIIEGKVAYSAAPAKSDTMQRVIWEVTQYQGQKAMVYVFDRSSEAWGHINVDDFRFYKTPPNDLLFPNSDFELGDLGNWFPTGDAFAKQPTKGDNAAVRRQGKAKADPVGQYYIGTYEAYQGKPDEKPGAEQGDQPKGTLRSIPFTIQGQSILFRIGGGKDLGLKVQLLINGRPVESATGDKGERLVPKVWLVDKYVGQVAEIEILDQSSKSWGHINVDDFRYGRIE